ncbi:dihydrodipicolinate synthase family protein [Solirubrobacter ginsenosidimutans]|uniref:Dihydrodipicolinate synthase family protein n=1 Tax=Solirubrobacter ginsenosidimutans TaxID=490573 RepID=A0A9X3MSG3_9ACTN|nr:dihydrodipicolinate synthase family protein [Solirubrobacter ginsenosidimutans]MDA0160398.1 dihydrodipicolinate synthase family protein [Solirubrobacter ginsenosidimutans]
MFTGLSAFPLTPLDDTGAIDERALQLLVTRLAEAGVHSIGALGSTGSYAYLTRAERARVARLAVGAAGGVPVMIGIGAVRTEHVIEHAHDAQQAGAAAVMLAPVSYQPLTDDEVYGLYADVTAELSVPLCVYDNPGTTRFAFSDALHARVAGLAGVAAIKLPGDGAAERTGALRPLVPASVAIGVSGDQFAAGALDAGADVWFSVVGGLFPELALAIVREGGPASARLEPLWALFRRYGGLRVVATAASLLGLAGARNLPRPLRLLDGDARTEVEAVLRGLG